jgi:hypothetical protein
MTPRLLPIEQKSSEEGEKIGRIKAVKTVKASFEKFLFLHKSTSGRSKSK